VALEAAYSFAGTGSTIVDDSGNGRSFTLPAGTVRGGGGLTRTSSGNSAGPALTGLQTANRSITCRISRTSVAADGWFPGFDASGTGVWGLIDLGGQRQARARNAGGVAAAQVAAVTPEKALAATYDGTNIRLYVDGTLVATTALAGPLRTDANTFFLFITTGSETVMKDLRIYSHTLTPTEVIADRDTPVAPLSAGAGQAAETDTAQPAGRIRTSTGGTAAETDTAQPAGRIRRTAAGVALETDTARAAGTPSSTAAGTAAEVDTALPAGRIRVTAAGTALETDQGLSAGRSRLSAAGLATETDTARSAGAARTTAAGTALELDTAMAAGNPNEITRDLELSGLVELDRWAAIIEGDRWAAELEPDRYRMGVEA
jgi:hypothetical protein